MPLLWDFGADGHSQQSDRASVTRAMEPVEHSLGAYLAQQCSHRILWHGVDSAPAEVPAASLTHGENRAKRQVSR